MKYWYQKPPSALTDYVRTVLVIEGFSKGGDTHLPLVTNGMPALLCHLEKQTRGPERVRHLTLYGSSVPSDSWKVSKTSTLIFCFFRPFALPCLFDLPASGIAKKPLPLSGWNRAKAKSLRERLENEVTTSSKTEALDQFLVEQFNLTHHTCKIIQEATDALMVDTGTTTLPTTLNRLRIHPRTFQRLFKKYVGVAPSHYRRICQFEQSFTHLRAGEFENLSDVAYTNGFADQSHFTRSFREFTATTPATYVKKGLKRKNK